MFQSFKNINKTKLIISIVLCLLPMLYYSLLYSHLPYLIPIHYNLAGHPDNFIDKASYTYLLPIVALVLSVFFIWIMHINPKINEVKSNLLYAVPYFMIPAIFNFFAILNLIAFIGVSFNINTVQAVVFGIMAIGFGYYTRKIPMNSSIGLRTPWSKASPELWQKSNNTAGLLVMLSGLLYIILGSMGFSFVTFVILLILSTIISIIMSYVYYKLAVKTNS